MPFLNDLLKVTGALALPAGILVGGPLAIVGGIVLSGGSAIGSKKLDDAEDRKKQQAAEQAQREAERKINEAQEKQKLQMHAAEQELKKNKKQVKLLKQIIEHCQANRLDQLPPLLRELTQEKFDEMGLDPVAACNSPEGQERVVEMIHAER